MNVIASTKKGSDSKKDGVKKNNIKENNTKKNNSKKNNNNTNISRDIILKQFIEQSFPGSLDSLTPIVGDAGQRDYYRIIFENNKYIVMDCPPNYCSVKPFVDISIYLQKNGFSAPQIISQDLEHGFLILEDFGSTSLKDYIINIIKCDQQKCTNIYHLVIDLLISLQNQKPPSNLPQYDNELLLSELKLFVEWYVPYTYKRKLDEYEIVEFEQIWINILKKQAPMQSSIVLRDYHVENLMYLENREYIQKLGLLDFQDALIGSPIYDLVSILEDARIDVPRKEAIRYLEYFVEKKEVDIKETLLNYHILGAQRNSRILGVFIRKLLRDKDNNYLQYIPRVLKYLKYNLSHATLNPLKNWLENLK